MKSAIRFVKFSIFLFLILCSIVIETKTYAEIGDTCTIMAPGFDTCASSGEVCVAPYGSEQGYCDTSCGNNQCEQNEGENYSNCPDDCECGNGVCDYGEWGSCSQDCFCNDDNTCDSLQGENQARCGIDECGCNNNDICENNRGETIYNCADCAVEGDGYCSSGESPTSPDCAQILCGNGQIDSGEVCDTSGNLGCGYNQGCFGCQVCEPIPVCGNGIIETQLYEQCDTASTLPNKGCNAGNTCVSLNGFPSGTAFCQCQPNTPVPPGDSSTCEISLTDCGMDCYSNNKPFDVFFVMDRSYSMVLGAKLNIMKTSFNSIIDALPTGSRASLITFNHAATLRNTLTTNLSSVRSWNPVNQNSVDYPEENSLTNYVDAFAKLTQEVNTHKSSFSGRNQLVYFFSDGEPTIGGPFVTQGPTHNGGNCTFGVINGQIVRTCSIGCNIPNDGCQYESATAAADAFHSTFSGLQTIAIGLDISQQHHYILANHVATPGLFSAIDSSVGISQIPKTPCYPYMQGYPNCTKPGPWTTDAFCASITQPINPLNKFVDQFCEMTCEPALCKVYTGNFAQQPAYNTPTGCIGGTYTDLPDAPNQWNWQCTGTDGTSHTCAAGQEPIGPMCHELTVVNLTGTTYEFTCSGTGTNYTIAITDQQGQPITTLQGPTATYTFQTGGTFTATCFIDGVTGLICPNNPTNPTNPTNPSNSGTPSHGSNTTNTSHQTSPGNTLLNNTLINNPTTTKGGTIQQPIVNKNAYNNAIVQNTVQQIITSVNSNEVNEVRPNNIVVLPPPPPIISTATPCYNPCQKTITVVMPEPEIFDLALRKTLPDSVAGYAPGGFVTFDIEVINQGNVPAQGIIISDYVPVGLTLQDPTWSYDANTRRAKKGYDSVLNPGETALFTITFKIDANASGKLINRAEITTDNGVDIDSTPDNDQANDCFGGDNVVTGDGSGTPNTPKCNPETDEDDHDPAELQIQVPTNPVYDLRIRKDVAAGPYTVGQTIQYTITIYNTGNITVSGLVTDILPVGLSYTGGSTYSFAPTQGGATITALGGGQRKVNNIAPGQYITMQYNVIIGTNATGTLKNNVKIIPDPLLPPELVPDNPGECIDDKNPLLSDSATNINNAVSGTNNRDCEEIQVQPAPKYDLRIKKDVSAGPYQPGQTVTYTLSVLNTGNIIASGKVTDILPIGLQYTGVATYSPSGYITQIGTGSWQVSNLEPGKIVTITYKVIIGQNSIGKLKNNVKIVPNPELQNEEIPDKEGICEIGNDPLINDFAVPDTNNRDCEEITVQPVPSYDLRIKKDVAAGPYTVGQTIQYTITIYNTGNITVSGLVTDILPVGLSYTGGSTYSFAPTQGGATITALGGGQRKVNNIAPGQYITMQYNVIIGTNATGTLKNNVKIIPDPLLPPELVPDNPGECIDDKNPLLSDSATNINNAVSGTNNRDCEEIQVQPAPKYDLRIKKDVSAGPYQPGQTVTYTLSVLNTGNIIASGKVTDILPIGLQYTGVATYSPSGYITQIGTGSWQVSNLEPGKIVTITYKVIIGQNSIGKLKNNVKIVPNPELQNEEIPDKEGICEIGNDPLINDFAVPDTNNRDCEEITVQPVPSYDLRIKKDVSAGPYASGQLITYTVTVLNTGTLAASGKVIDTLPVGLTYTGSQILSSSKITNAGTGMWMITNLLPNEQVTISYKVIIGALSGPKKNIVSVFPEGNSTPEIIPYLTGACEIGHNPLINDFAVPKTNNTDCEEIIITESMSCVASAQPNDTTVKSKNHTMTVQCDIKNMTGTVSVDCGNGTTGSMVTKTSAECKYTEYGSYVATCMVDAKKITGCNRPITLVKGGGGDPSSICISMIPSKPKNIYYTRKHDADIKCDVSNYPSSDISIDCGNGTKKPGFEGTCEYRNYGSYTIQCLAKGKPVNKCATSLTLEGNNGGGPNCGDGKKDKGEQCDDGSKNGTPTSLCSKTCSLKVIDPDPSDTPVCAFVDPPSIQMGEYVPFWWDLEDELETIQGNNCTEKTVGAVRLDTMVCDFTVLAPGGKTYSYTKKCNEDNLKSVKWYNDLQKDLKTKIMPRWGQSVLDSSEWKKSGYGEYAISLEKITYDVCTPITSETTSGKVTYELTTNTYEGRVCQFNFAITAPYMMQKGSVLSSLEDDRTVLQGFHQLDGRSILDRRGERINFMTKTSNTNTFEQVKKFAYDALEQVVSKIDATHPLAFIAPVVKRSPREEIYLVEGNVNISHTSSIGLNRGKATTIIVKGPYTVTINGGLPANLLLIVPEGKVVFNNIDCDSNDVVEGILLAKDFQTTATRKILTNTDLRANERCQGGQLIVKGLIVSDNANAFATLRSQRRSTLARWFDGTKTKEEHIYGGASLRIDANAHQWDKLPPLAKQTSMVFKLQGTEFGLSIPVYFDGSLLPFYLNIMIAAGEVSEVK